MAELLESTFRMNLVVDRIYNAHMVQGRCSKVRNLVPGGW